MPRKSGLSSQGTSASWEQPATTTTIFCLQTRQGNVPPTRLELRLRVSSSSHINHTLYYSQSSHCWRREPLLRLGPEFSYLNRMRKTDLLKRFICFSFPDLSSRDWVMLHLRQTAPREVGFWWSWCILVLTLSFNHTGPNLTWLCARTDAQARSPS